jgi:hypothetical protein
MVGVSNTGGAGTRNTSSGVGSHGLGTSTGTCDSTRTNAAAKCNGDVNTEEARNKTGTSTGTAKKTAENEEAVAPERQVASAEKVAASRQVASLQGAAMRDALARALADRNVG